MSAVCLGLLGFSCARDASSAGPPLAPTPPDSSLYTVSGTIFEIVAQRPVPIQSRVSFEYRRPNESFSTGGLVNASDGSYVLEHVSSGTALTLRATATIGSWREQPCGVNALVRSDTKLDIELVQTGTVGSTTGSPRLSGLVYEMTPAGRQPIADADVAYVSGCSGLAGVYARTDGQGRYAFCRVPSGPGCVVAARERFGGPWFAKRQVGTNIQGDAVLDIELVGGEPPPGIRSVTAISRRTARRYAFLPPGIGDHRGIWSRKTPSTGAAR